MSTRVYFVTDGDVPEEFKSLPGVQNLAGRPYLHIGGGVTDLTFVCGVPDEFIDFITFDDVVASEDAFVEQGIYEEAGTTISVETFDLQRADGTYVPRQKIEGRSSRSIEHAKAFLRRVRSGDCFPTESWDRKK